MSSLTLSRPTVGVGVQGSDWQGLKEWGPESILGLQLDFAELLKYYEDVPKPQRPWLWLRWYYPNVMAESPKVYGLERGLESVRFADLWGEHFAGVQLTNELNLGIEHGNHPETTPYWTSRAGYQAIRDWYLQAIEGFDSSAPDLHLAVLSLSPGHNEDGPAPRALGWYGYQDGLLGDVVNYQRKGRGKLLLGTHGYWEKSGVGLRDMLAPWYAFRLVRPQGYKDTTEHVQVDDPGGSMTIFPDVPHLWGEWNSEMVADPAHADMYAQDVVYFHDRVQMLFRGGQKILGTHVFLWNSFPNSGNEFLAHAGTKAMDALKAYKDSLPPLAELPEEEPMPTPDYAARWPTEFAEWEASGGVPNVDFLAWMAVVKGYKLTAEEFKLIVDATKGNVEALYRLPLPPSP